MDIMNNRNRLLMLMSGVLMALSLTLIVFNYTGTIEYSKHNTISFSLLFVAATFLFIKNMKRQ